MLDTGQFQLKKTAEEMQKAAGPASTAGKKPHPCPLCRGAVRPEHALSLAGRVMPPCLACGGSGIVWG